MSHRLAIAALALAGFPACSGAPPPQPSSPSVEPPAPSPPEGPAASSSPSPATASKAAPEKGAPPLARDSFASPPEVGPRDPSQAAPEPPFRQPLPPARLEPSAPAMRFANLSPTECRKLLDERELPVQRDRGPAKGIATPLRLSAPLHGVRFIAPGGSSPYGKLDCRLALTLAELARLLEPHGVRTVRVDNMYRPHARLPRRRRRSQHAYGLAIDIMELTLADGRRLVVEDDWHSPIGSAACGPEAAPEPATEKAILLRNVVCDIARSGLFHHMLTPSYNAAHKNHFHFDIKRNATRSTIE